MAPDPPMPAREERAEPALLPDGVAGRERPGALLDGATAGPPASETVAVPLRLPSAATAALPPHAAYLARRRFGSLDGLRALGILAVVWHHTVGGPGRLGANLFF